MAKIRKLASSFVSGVISPKLAGRTTLNKYDSGLKQGTNVIPSIYGDLYRRPRTLRISDPISNSVDSNLISFQYSNQQTYVLEFGNNVLRFYTNQGLLLQGRGITNGTFPAGITGWTARNSGAGAISHDAVNFRMTLTGGGVGNEARAYQSLAYYGTGTYTITLDVFTATTTWRVGTSIGGSQLGTGTLTVGTGKTFSFTPTTNGTVYIEFENAATSSIDNIVISSPAYQIDTPYATGANLQIIQSYDTLFIVDGTVAPRQLQRISADQWALTTMSFTEPAYLDKNTTTTTITPSGTTGSVTLTASSAIFASTDVGRAVRYKSGRDNSENISPAGTGAQTYFDIPFYPQTSTTVLVNFIESTGARTAKTYTAGVPGAGQFTITGGQVRTGDTATTSQLVEIKPADAGAGTWGYAIITGYTNSTTVTATVYSDFAGTIASKEWRLGAWSDTTGYPRAIAIHDQRLVFAGTTSNPSTIWGSQIGNYTNMQPDTILLTGDIADDTSYSITLGGNSSQAIQWLVSKGSLIVGTVSSIWSIKGTSGIITATDKQLRNESSVGAARLLPVTTENEVLFIDYQQTRVYSIAYSFQLDGYAVEEVSLYTRHYGLESKFTRIAYQSSYNILWTVREDGTFLSCTYIKGQQINGWADHFLGGTDPAVKSITTIEGTDNTELWIHASRTIDSATARSIEVLNTEFDFQDRDTAAYTDYSSIYDGAPATTITGLDYLEGEEVLISADGNQLPPATVTGGEIELDKAASYVIIGLPYKSSFETLKIEGGSVIGTSQSAISRITDVALLFYKSLGGAIGTSSDSELTEIIYDSNSVEMDTTIPLFSGWYSNIKFNGSWDRGYSVYFETSDVYPVTILSMVYTANVTDLV
jgi:hypothetical protein